MPALVGIDVGTTGVKAVAISETGDVVAVAEEGYELSMPQPGWSEQDPEDWWRASETALARLGVGAVEPGTLSVVLGTSGVVLATLPGYAADPQARLHVFCHAAPALWEAMGVMLSAAGSLQWFRHALAPGATYDELTAEAERWP